MCVLTMTKKLVKFLILFDKADLVYFPGQFINGRVIVELDKDTLVDGVFFHVHGEGTVRLKSKKNKWQLDKENYINFKMKLLGEPDGRPVLLSTGIHSFPFQLGLPLGLPSTFLARHGWVQYVCRTALREHSGLLHKNHQVFVVISPIDLNMEPSTLARPVQSELEHRLGSSGSSCCPSLCSCTNSADKPNDSGASSRGSLFCQVRVARAGYVPGESIAVSAVIDNRSRQHVRKTSATLVETIQYIAACGESLTERRPLSRVTRGRVAAGHYVEWVEERLPIPAMPPTNLRGCHLIQIGYDVEFTVKPSGCARPVSLHLPVVIATYPYRSRNSSIPPAVAGPRDTEYPSTLPVCRPWMKVKYSTSPHV